jgi:hypothetical protein
MMLEKPNNPDENEFKKWLTKWKSLELVPPRKDGLRAVCWLAGFGALLHPPFAYLPAKWPLFLMDGFLLTIVLLVMWHERNGCKK